MTAPTTARTRPLVALFQRIGPRSWLGTRVVRLVRGRRTTPGKLRILRVTLVLMFLLAGGLGVYKAADQIQAVEDISRRDERLSADTAEIYRSLADADVTAVSGFLAGGLEPSDVRERYMQDISQAASSLVRASGEIGAEGPAAGSIARVNALLPEYTGLVETTRANHRQGFPVAGRYLRRASELMQLQILPAAEELHQSASEQLDGQYRQALAVSFPSLLLQIASLIALVVAQVVLFRRTNRVFNVGLVAATAMTVGLTLWWTGASALAQRHLGEAQRHSTATVVLGKAQIAALKARSNESLALVARDGRGGRETDFNAQAGRLVRELEQAPDFEDRAEVVTAAQAWLTAHARVRELDDNRMYSEAVAAATGPDPAGAGTAFNRLDEALRVAIEAERREFDMAVDQGRRVFTGLDIGTGVLTLLAARAAAWGIGRRLEEYR